MFAYFHCFTLMLFNVDVIYCDCVLHLNLIVIWGFASILEFVLLRVVWLLFFWLLLFALMFAPVAVIKLWILFRLFFWGVLVLEVFVG